MNENKEEEEYNNNDYNINNDYLVKQEITCNITQNDNKTNGAFDQEKNFTNACNFEDDHMSDPNIEESADCQDNNGLILQDNSQANLNQNNQNTYPNNNIFINNSENSLLIPQAVNFENIQKNLIINNNEDKPQIENPSNLQIGKDDYEPWDYANNHPEEVIQGTEVIIYPFPDDITKQEIYDNFSILGDIIDIRIYPMKKNSKNIKSSDEIRSKNIKRLETDLALNEDKASSSQIDQEMCECLVRFKDIENTQRVLKLTNARFDVI